jgi:hypothetical protein
MARTDIRLEVYKVVVEAAPGLETDDAVRVLADEYRALAAMEDEERLHAIRTQVQEEHKLDDADLRLFTLARLRALTTLTPEQARDLARDYDDAMSGMPAAAAMRRVVVVQSVIARMSESEQETLRSLLPENVTGPAAVSHNLQAQSDPVRRSKKRWPIFWQRKGAISEAPSMEQAREPSLAP